MVDIEMASTDAAAFEAPTVAITEDAERLSTAEDARLSIAMGMEEGCVRRRTKRPEAAAAPAAAAPVAGAAAANGTMLHDFAATEAWQASAREGEVVAAHSLDADGWVDAETAGGARGLLPANFMRLDGPVPPPPTEDMHGL